MGMFEFSAAKVPEIPNIFKTGYYNRFKRSLVGILLSQRLQVFEDEGGASGKWQPLSNKYAAKRIERVSPKKRRSSGAVQILSDSGVLRQSFTAARGPGNSERIIETDGDEVRLATNVEYAAIHNFGGEIKHPGTTNGFGSRGWDGDMIRPGIVIPAHTINIPARPFDEFSDHDLEEINTATELFVNGQL